MIKALSNPAGKCKVSWHWIKTLANPRHCRDSNKVKTLQLSPAMPLLSLAPNWAGFPMTGALESTLYVRFSFKISKYQCKLYTNDSTKFVSCLNFVNEIYSFNL